MSAASVLIAEENAAELHNYVAVHVLEYGASRRSHTFARRRYVRNVSNGKLTVMKVREGLFERGL